MQPASKVEGPGRLSARNFDMLRLGPMVGGAPVCGEPRSEDTVQRRLDRPGARQTLGTSGAQDLSSLPGPGDPAPEAGP